MGTPATQLPLVTTLAEVIGNTDLGGGVLAGPARCAIDTFAAQLAGELGPYVAGGALGYASWTELAADTSRGNKQLAIVLGDTGTHTDPVTAVPGVSNSGTFKWSASPAGWQRIGDVLGSVDAAAMATVQGQVADVSRRISLVRARPGDAYNDFSTTLAGAPEAIAGLDSSKVINTALGNVYRVTGATSIATRRVWWLEPNRIFAIRALYSRFANPTDPAGDNVRVLIQWLNSTYAAISTTIVQDITLALVSGIHTTSARVPSQSGDSVSIVAPTGAVYFRVVFQTFGADGVTDLIAMSSDDITTSTVYAPDVTALTGRVSALESSFAGFSPLAAGAPGGYATLDGAGQLLLTQLKMSRSGESHITAPLVTRARNSRWITDADNITGNGTSDDTVAAQAQIDAAVDAGQALLIPDNCIIRTTAPLLINRKTLRMLGSSPPMVRNPAYPGVGPSNILAGSFFNFDHTGKGLSYVGGSNDPDFPSLTNDLMHSRLKGIGTKRNQPATTGGSFTPIAADYDIYVDHAIIEVSDCVCPNPTKWMKVTNLGIVNVRHIRGQPLQEFIHIENTFDVQYIDDIFLQLYWSPDTAVQTYMQANGVVYKFGHVDGIKMGRSFALSYNIGMDVYAYTGAGGGSFPTVNRGTFQNVEFDACKTALLLEGSIATGASMHFGYLGSFQNGPQDGTGAADSTATIFGSNSTITMNQFDPGVTRGSMMVIDGAGSNNKVRIAKVLENTFSLATVVNSYALRALGNNSITVDDYVKKAGYSPGSARANGNVRVTLARGFETITTDVNGQIIMNHLCGNGSPTFFSVRIRGGAVQCKVETDPNATQVKLTFYNQSGTIVASSPVSFQWQAGYDFTALSGDF